MTQTSFEVCQHNNVTKTKKMIRTMEDDSDLLGTSASEHVRAQSIVKEQGEKVVRRTRAENQSERPPPQMSVLKTHVSSIHLCIDPFYELRVPRRPLD